MHQFNICIQYSQQFRSYFQGYIHYLFIFKFIFELNLNNVKNICYSFLFLHDTNYIKCSNIFFLQLSYLIRYTILFYTFYIYNVIIGSTTALIFMGSLESVPNISQHLLCYRLRKFVFKEGESEEKALIDYIFQK